MDQFKLLHPDVILRSLETYKIENIKKCKIQ